LVDIVERGDHALFVGHVVAAHVPRAIEGRPDDATLWLRELGPKTFYGG
jgi:flavin reductase (DIM6/NTAB) family NADH-FMN oxidoreductase RutF